MVGPLVEDFFAASLSWIYRVQRRFRAFFNHNCALIKPDPHFWQICWTFDVFNAFVCILIDDANVLSKQMFRLVYRPINQYIMYVRSIFCGSKLKRFFLVHTVFQIFWAWFWKLCCDVSFRCTRTLTYSQSRRVILKIHSYYFILWSNKAVVWFKDIRSYWCLCWG